MLWYYSILLLGIKVMQPQYRGSVIRFNALYIVFQIQSGHIHSLPQHVIKRMFFLFWGLLPSVRADRGWRVVHLQGGQPFGEGLHAALLHWLQVKKVVLFRFVDFFFANLCCVNLYEHLKLSGCLDFFRTYSRSQVYACVGAFHLNEGWCCQPL